MSPSTSTNTTVVKQRFHDMTHNIQSCWAEWHSHRGSRIQAAILNTMGGKVNALCRNIHCFWKILKNVSFNTMWNALRQLEHCRRHYNQDEESRSLRKVVWIVQISGSRMVLPQDPDFTWPLSIELMLNNVKKVNKNVLITKYWIILSIIAWYAKANLIC